MARLSEKGLEEVSLYFKTQGKKHGEMIPQYEDAINNSDKKITDYLVQVSSYSLSDHDSRLHHTLMSTVRDIESIGDHMENIMELVDYQITSKIKFSESAGIVYVDIVSNLERVGDHAVNIAEEVIGEE